MNQTELPHKVQIQQIYDSYVPVFEEILGKIENRLKSVIRLPSMPTYKARIKSFGSYYKKILRQKSEESSTSHTLVTLTDMMGIRIICAFLEDIDNVVRQLSAHFEVREIERKGSGQSVREFGYESVHVLINIPDGCYPTEHLEPVLPGSVVCEIQVRTILQDAWAEVEHELIYKSEFNPFDKPLRRKLAAINANLTLADTIFQEIRDYQNKLQSELDVRRNTFYEKADEITEHRHFSSEGEVSAGTMALADESPYAKGSIDDMVLQALHEHNLGHFTNAVAIYTRIIESPDPLPDMVLAVIFKHRGMAHFAQNNYDKALSDFQESEKRDDNAFRACYYEGIVYSIKERHAEAVECFDRSLRINKYQSHVYYRRALAFYKLHQYEAAMQDVNSAIGLGLEDDDVQQLKSRLLSKFDMKV
ncbi:MAG TPA: (p)ppGpp synthetase [Treponema sp.]|nr:(p)ppGpp synthetase [Treponema sp.]